MVDLPDRHDDFARGFATALWVKPTAPPSNRLAFLEMGNGQDVDDVWLGWVGGSGVEIYFSDTVDGHRARWLDDDILPVLNAWQHYAVSVDNSGNATMYRNGVETTSGFLSLPKTLIRTQNELGSSAWSDGLRGAMDDVRLYNRPISLEEIQQIYAAGSGVDGVRIIKWIEVQ